MRTTLRHLFENPIRAFALLCVACTSAFLVYVNLRLIDILSDPNWCNKAVQAERIIANDKFTGVNGCVEILKLQIGSLADVLKINSGTFALCLLVLVVIVVAGARLAAKLFGNEMDMSRDPAAKAADQVAGAAVEEAEQIKGG